MNDYNFEIPETNLEVAAQSTVEIGGNHRYELYEHPGNYRRKAQGDAAGAHPYARNRVDLACSERHKLLSSYDIGLSFHAYRT